MDSQPAAATVACADEDAARRFQQACHTPYFRPYTSTDVTGCELGGAVKNVIALAVGIASGMGLGDNATAMLITRGLAETTRLAVAMGAHPATLAGLSGMGDLVATCSSPLSRNRTFGTHLGQGLSVEEATAATRQTTEGVKSAEAILALPHAHGVEMPITEVFSALLHEKVTLDGAAAALMQGPPSQSADPGAPRGHPPLHPPHPEAPDHARVRAVRCPDHRHHRPGDVDDQRLHSPARPLAALEDVVPGHRPPLGTSSSSPGPTRTSFS